ncbi:hypothetical protein BJ878DRAFT_214701 [Calycina marina]|uniref:Uncharacterized protein n=1 Tax=Calycina marina TaxID=1763456 RepID=A0A9P7YXT8_9HELO|nr:hypothetical protein BJ878DRAFT_214701 [Calycina marina]
MDAGGLAQMSYNNFSSGNGLGMPSSGFASRRGANSLNVKHLSFKPSQSSDQDNGAPTPRTSRSHLLAGLRTAPKSATGSAFPSTAPPTQLYHQNGLGGSIYAERERTTYGGPKTSNYLGQQNSSGQSNGGSQMYSVPEQILTPPDVHVDDQTQQEMDPNLYAQLVATNMYLAEQQQRLQQQLLSVQAAAQQFQGMDLSVGNHMQQFQTPPITSQNMGRYQQQVETTMQPIITPVIGAQAGVYSYYDPMTGQQSYFMDNSQQTQYMGSQVLQQSANHSPPQKPGTPHFQVSPPPADVPTFTRSISPPKKSQSPPQDHAPLPPPSVGAFRRGHRQMNSLALYDNALRDAPKTAGLPKISGFSMTPLTSGLGPGQGRAGEHPYRQPRGPPPLDELLAKPTTRFEGSKNFSARTRRSAVHNIVRAGKERRMAPGSSGSMSPVSETAGEITFSVPSDNDSESGSSTGSGRLSGRPALGSPRHSVHGAIGSDRPSSQQKEHSVERKSIASRDSAFTTASVNNESRSVDGSFAAVFKNGGKKPEDGKEDPRKSPMLILTSADKRKSFS